jgi:plasmid maintenance system antidote protein VapI
MNKSLEADRGISTYTSKLATQKYPRCSAPPIRLFMKLYHFLSEKWALEALKGQQLKVSKYEDLNDPFELLAMSLGDKFSRTVMKETKTKINKILRILCCSKRWASPLLWGHYAEKHTGIALALEVPEETVQEITYEKDRTSLDIHALMKAADENAKLEMFKMFTTKYEQWTYEEEARIQFSEEDYFRKGNHDFINLGQDIKLVGLILGPLNKTKREVIQNHIPPSLSVEVTTTRIAFQAFDVVHQKRGSPYTLHG